ncbi:hypothetical protein [Burkholderia cepacia]|uniref:hypothetical protein n=1 Tax=Burkholderia cepacia TaxID=292 RepID=UPI00158DD1ED|nr:hypothetical protein [Burkholderia cepacia]
MSEDLNKKDRVVPNLSSETKRIFSAIEQSKDNNDVASAETFEKYLDSDAETFDDYVEEQNNLTNKDSNKSKKKEILKVSAICLLVVALGGFYFLHHGKKKDDTLFDEPKPVVKQEPVRTEPQQPVVAKKWQDMKYNECIAVYNDGYNKKMNLLIKAKDGMQVDQIERDIRLPECDTLPDSPKNLKLKEQQQIQSQSVVVPKVETPKAIEPPKQVIVEQPKIEPKPVVAEKSKLNVVNTPKIEVAEQPKVKHEIKHVHKEVKDIVVTEPKQQVQKSQSPSKAWYE